MLKIKLKPTGKIHQRSFRIVVSPDRSKSNGKFIDDLGFYTPQTKTLQIDKEKMTQWLKNGAQLTLGVDKLLNPDKYPRKKKIKKSEEKVVSQPKTETPAAPPKTEEVKTEEVKVPEAEEAKEEPKEESKEEVKEEVK